MFLIWINSHASFILGIAVAFAYLVASFFEFELGALVARRWNPAAPPLFHVVAPAICCRFFVNPAGFKQIYYPIDTLMNMKLLMANVEEWAPLQLTEARGIGLIAIIFCILLMVTARKAESIPG